MTTGRHQTRLSRRARTKLVQRRKAAEDESLEPPLKNRGYDAATSNEGLLGLHQVVGNRAAGSMLREGPSNGAANAYPALAARSADPAAVIQRATFAELMAFWKTQELGAKPPAPTGETKTSGNVPPEPSNEQAMTETSNSPAQDSIPDENKAEAPAKESSPVSETLSSDESDTASSDTAGSAPLFGGVEQKYGGQQHLPTDSLGDVRAESSPVSETRKSGEASTAALDLGEGKASTQYDDPPGLGEGKVSSKASTTVSSDTENTPFAVATPKGAPGNKTKVKYLTTEEARREFELNVNGAITQNGQPYDTSQMYSKFKGSGFGIFVMGKDGRFYSTSHKIGLFHHSSFLAGGDVAAAGEMKVVGGTLQHITNKSGHYMPTELEMAQALHAMKGASGLSTATLGVFMGGKFIDPYPGGPEKLMEVMGSWGAGKQNKDSISYETKPIEPGYSKETESSVSIVRALIRDFLGKAQMGKLRAFPTPDPNFGNKPEDIKELVLKEFGWTEEDTVTYAAVLENWDNNDPIGDDLPGPVPLDVDSSLTSSLTSSSAAVSDDDKRDYEGELAELLRANPNPDWESLGFTYIDGDLAIEGSNGSYVTVKARHKVLVLKGEATIDDLRPD